MAIEVRCIEHLSVEQRQSLHLLYGPLMGKSSICLYEFLGSIQNSVELEDVYLLLNINASQFDKARNYLEQYHETAKTVKSEEDKVYARLLLATDFIAGMTDSYAKRLYQELRGI